MKDLREFIDRVKELGELKVVEGANWDLEIGAISHMVAKGSNNPPALLFDKVEGYKAGYRVFTIPYCNKKRAALTLRLPLELTKLELVKKLRDRFSEPVELVPPVEVKEGPIMQNIHTGDEVDLFEFPTPKWHPIDGGRYIGTGVTVIVRDPDEGWVNVSANRIQIHDKSTATIRIVGGDASRISEKYWKRGESCPAAVTCGGDPLHIFVAGTRIPWGMSEYDYVGWLAKEPVEVIKGPTTGLPIPAYSEIVLEGEMVPPEVETRIEGPYLEEIGYCSMKKKPFSAFRVKCILHRDDPIILGLPFLGHGVSIGREYMTAARLWKSLSEMVPGVKGVWTPAGFQLDTTILIISIEQQYAGHAKQVGLAARSLGMYKYVIVVEDDIDPTNLDEVFSAVGYRASPEDIDIVRGCKTSLADPILSPQKIEAGDITQSAAIILACKPYHWIDSFPPSLEVSPELRQKVKEKWGGLLFRESP